MKVVSDSSPLIGLARIECLDLLPRLYNPVLIPSEVFMEVSIAGKDLPGSTQIAAAAWIEVIPVEDRASLAEARLKSGLGAGETASVALARQLAADLILMDERRARRFAKDQGFSVIGCVGLLEILYRAKHLPDLREAYARLLDQEFRIHRKPLQESLARLGLPLL